MMIHKILTPRPSFKSVLQYAGDKKDAEIIGGNQPAFFTGELIKKFEEYEKLNRKSKAPVFHATLSLPSGEHLTDEQWQESVEFYLKKIGYDPKMNPFTIIKHGDTNNEHVHIIANKIRLDGKNARIKKGDYLRGMEACRELEKKLNIKTGKKNPEKKAKPNAYEQKQAQRLGKDATAKEKIQIAIDEIVENNEFNLQTEQGRDFFGTELAKKGVSIKYMIQQNGKLTGISFSYEKMAYKGTALGTDYKASAITKRALHTAEKNQKIREYWEQTNGKIQKMKKEVKKFQDMNDDYWHKWHLAFKATQAAKDEISKFVCGLLELCAILDKANARAKALKAQEEIRKEYENFNKTKTEIKETPIAPQSAAGAAPSGAGAPDSTANNEMVRLDSADLLAKATKLAQTQASQGLQETQKNDLAAKKGRGR